MPLATRHRDMTLEQKLLVNLTLVGLLEPDRREDQDQVRRCLERQGGLEACSRAFYQEHDLNTPMTSPFG